MLHYTTREVYACSGDGASVNYPDLFMTF